MATIFTRKTESGILRYYSDITIDGKRYRKYLGLSKKTASQALRALEYDIRFAIKTDTAPSISYSQAIQRFKIHIELTGITYEQVKYIGSRIQSFQKYCIQHGIVGLENISSDIAQKYLAKRKLEKVRKTYNYGKERKWKHPATSTINREIGFQKRFFRYCLDNGWIPRNPWALIQRVKDVKNKEPRYAFTTEELKIIFEASGRFHDFYYFLLHTGLRPTDTFVLTSESFKDNIMNVKQRKTGDWLQNIPISDEVMDIVTTRSGDGGLLFPELQSDRQRRYARRLIQGLFEPAFVRKNNINLHTFRHTYAHRMLNRGVPKEVLQTFLGHRSIRTTEIYANWVSRTELKKWVR
jgi:site-specific recombinase XerD